MLRRRAVYVHLCILNRLFVSSTIHKTVSKLLFRDNKDAVQSSHMRHAPYLVASCFT